MSVTGGEDEVEEDEEGGEEGEAGATCDEDVACSVHLVRVDADDRAWYWDMGFDKCFVLVSSEGY